MYPLFCKQSHQRWAIEFIKLLIGSAIGLSPCISIAASHIPAVVETDVRGATPEAQAEPYQCAEGVEAKVALDLHYPEDLAHQSACKKMPSDPAKSVVALATIRPDSVISGEGNDGIGDYDLDVLIVKSVDGQKIRHLHIDKMLTSDAARFEGLAIDTARYQLTPTIRAFGVLALHHRYSRLNPYSDTILSLYIEGGKKIRQVLDQLIVNTEFGEWDDRCTGSWSSIDRTVKIGASRTKGFADLIVTTITTTNTIKETESDLVSEEQLPQFNCIEQTETQATHNILRYDGKKYVIPARVNQLR